MRYQKPIIEVSNKIFQNENFHRQFIGKKVLLIIEPISSIVDGQSVAIFTVFQKFFDSIGCKNSVFLLTTDVAQLTTRDFFAGKLDDLKRIFPEDDFDFVILLNGLESSLRPLKVIADLKRICRIGGNLLLLTRKPSREMTCGLGSNIYFYEDLWRFAEQDILNLFPEDDVQFLSNLEFPDDCDENGDTRSLFSQITLKTKSNPTIAPKIFNCRARCRTDFDDSNAFGYFHHGELDQIGIDESTDKSRLTHNYLDKYEFFLTPFRDRKITLLELGVYYGSSLRMWKKFFPKAQIIGVDIIEEFKKYAEPRIQIEMLDLSLIENLESLKKYQPRIIIDDASHFWSHQIKAMSVLFSCLPSGGIYIIEDMETSFELPRLNYSDCDLFKDFQIDAYTFCELINRVVASKLKLHELFDESPIKNLEIDGLNLENIINEIGLQTEFAGVMKGACIFIKR